MNTTNTMQDLQLLREPEVAKLTGLSRSQRYRLVADGLFPAPVRIGKRVSAWKASAIRQWLDGLQAVGSPPSPTSTSEGSTQQ